MELKTAGTTASAKKKIYEKPRIEIVNLVADKTILGGFCQDVGESGSIDTCDNVESCSGNS